MSILHFDNTPLSFLISLSNQLLLSNKLFTRLQLTDEIWGMESNTIDTTVNVHINRLRKKFEEWP